MKAMIHPNPQSSEPRVFFFDVLFMARRMIRVRRVWAAMPNWHRLFDPNETIIYSTRICGSYAKSACLRFPKILLHFIGRSESSTWRISTSAEKYMKIVGSFVVSNFDEFFATVFFFFTFFWTEFSVTVRWFINKMLLCQTTGVQKKILQNQRREAKVLVRVICLPGATLMDLRYSRT